MNVLYLKVILYFEALVTEIGPAGQDSLILFSTAALPLLLKGSPQSLALCCLLFPQTKLLFLHKLLLLCLQ